MTVLDVRPAFAEFGTAAATHPPYDFPPLYGPAEACCATVSVSGEHRYNCRRAWREHLPPFDLGGAEDQRAARFHLQRWGEWDIWEAFIQDPNPEFALLVRRLAFEEILAPFVQELGRDRALKVAQAARLIALGENPRVTEDVMHP